MIANFNFTQLWLSSLYGDNGECARVLADTETTHVRAAIEARELVQVHLHSTNADMMYIADFTTKYGVWLAGEQTLVNNDLPAAPGNVCMRDDLHYMLIDADAIYVLKMDVSYQLQRGLM